MRDMRISVKKLTLMAVLTAAALIISIIEARIPLPVSIPGVKLGLANTVTLFALFYGSGADGLTAANAFMILICRIVLGSLFSGRFVTLVYSFAGGLLAFAAQVLLRKIVSAKQLWACGAISAVFHNIGQILAAMWVTGTPSVAAYLPVLIIAGVITGIITGLVAQFTLARIPR